MRFLIAALFDDNYGDMIIRTCFTQLLKVALDNLGEKDYEIEVMSLKDYEEEKIVDADVMFFPGGGLFGLSYLKFNESIEKILDIAELNGTSVIFSSLGSNNMDATEADTEKLKAFFKRKCIKAVSVRENPDMFRFFAEGAAYDIVPVCDPAIWADPVYFGKGELATIRKARNYNRPLVGINFVRGGLFGDNGVDKKQADEEKLLYELSIKLDEAGIDSKFYTNGSVLDCAALLRFVSNYDISADKYVLCDTTRELVSTIAQFDAIAAIRMHSSIISYALDIPSFNLVWNPKIPFFYENISYPDRVIMPDEWEADKLFDMTEILLKDAEYTRNPKILMSLYCFLVNVLNDIYRSKKKSKAYSYDEVYDRLTRMEVPLEEDISDMHFKILKAENQYNYAKAAKNEVNSELKETTRDLRRSRKENEKLSRDKERLTEKYTKVREERNALKRRLNRIDSKAIVKLYHKVKGVKKGNGN